MIQLELFNQSPKQHLFKYWENRLKEWPKEVFESRHRPDSSGFGMAMRGGKFADLLFREQGITKKEYSRWQKFEKRVMRLGYRHGHFLTTQPKQT